MKSPVESEILQELCQLQNLAVLATESGSWPYASLVAVAFTSDLRGLYFVTPRTTRKWANLSENSHIALLLDNRSNQVADFSRAAAATVIGVAQALTGTERERGLEVFLSRHPHLADFSAAPTCTLFRVDVERIYLVTRFQNVTEFHFPS
ncbi:MAG: pyridoxamine 5'-phosphate oxidase family protein [Syntrophotaleaceae bacterium]